MTRAFAAGKHAEFPLSADALNQIRLDARKVRVSGGVGAHVRRKLGQSLDYRDHAAYVPGDDVRTIDWRLSLRLGHGSDSRRWLVRRFEAEESLTITVAIDTRASLDFPDGAPKLRAAIWIAEAMMRIAVREKWRASFVDLGGFADGPHAAIGGAALAARFGAWKDAIARRPPPTGDIRIEPILERLPPTAVLVLATDLLLGQEVPDGDGEPAVDDAADRHALVKLLDRAQSGFRQVILAHLDSWPAERAMIAGAEAELRGIDGRALFDGPRHVDHDDLDRADRAHREHNARILDAIPRRGLVVLEDNPLAWPSAIGQTDSPDERGRRLAAWFGPAFARFLARSGIVRQPT